MSEYEQMKKMLSRIHNSGWDFDDDNMEITIPCSNDCWYTLTLCFDKDGNLIDF